MEAVIGVCCLIVSGMAFSLSRRSFAWKIVAGCWLVVAMLWLGFAFT